jgi:hypothetical protein
VGWNGSAGRKHCTPPYICMGWPGTDAGSTGIRKQCVELSCNLTENTVRVHYKDQTVIAVWINSDCVL